MKLKKMFAFYQLNQKILQSLALYQKKINFLSDLDKSCKKWSFELKGDKEEDFEKISNSMLDCFEDVWRRTI